MATIIQVTFDPTKWAAGSGGAGTSYGCNGYDASSVVLDRDGVTAWAFETPDASTGFAAGFARISLADGSIVHQDAIFNQPGANPSTGFNTAYATTGNVFWQQDDAGHYYTSMMDTGTYAASIYKFHIAAGPANNLLNGYCVGDAILTGGAGFARYMQDMTVWTNGGVHYLAWVDQASSGEMTVINADTMTVIGTYTPNPANNGRSVFVDSSNVLWAVFWSTYVTNGTRLVRWDPADGATLSVLNIASHTITDATLGFTGVICGAYVPANNSVLLSGGGSAFTASVCGIDLTTFLQTAFHADDQTLLYQYELGPQLSAFDTGVKSGVLALPGDTISGGVPSLTQFGGILNIIDPVALTLSSSINITTAINASAVPTPVPLVDLTGDSRGLTSLPPFGTMAYDAASGTLAVTYETTPSISSIIGSPVYLYITAVPTYSISGNAGVAGATVSWTGTASGSTTADGSGNYTIPSLANGSYTIAAAKTGYTFTGPTPANPQVVSGANLTNVNFVAFSTTAAVSQVLIASQYTANVPPGAIVVGVVVSITGKQTDVSSASNLTVTPNNPVLGATSHTFHFGATNTTVTFGSPTSLWAMPWSSPSSVNSPDFGFRLTASETGLVPVTFSVSEVKATVYYQTSGSYILARDLTTWADAGHSGQSDGVAYDECFITVGSITLSPLGAPMFPLQHIVGYFDAAGTLHNGGASQPDIWIMPNEISDQKGIGFIQLPEILQEPPQGQNQPSASILALRYPVNMMNSALASQFVHHLQVKIQFEPENAPNTIKAIAFKSEQD